MNVFVFVLWLTKPLLSGLGIRGPLGTADALLAVVSVCRMLHTCCVWFVSRLMQHCTGWRHRTLSISAPTGQSSLVFAAVFVVVWCGAAVVTINAQLLGGHV